MIRTILFLVSAVVILGVICVFVFNNKGQIKKKGKGTVLDVSSQKPQKKKINLIASIALCGSVVFTIFVPASFHQVEAGQVAVVKELGKVVGIRQPGTYFDFCLTRSYTFFDTTVQKLDIQTMSYSSDAQTMDISMTIQYKIDADKAEDILIEYTSMESLEQRIEKVADDRTKSVLSQYTAMKIIETRAAISPEVEKMVKEAVGNQYYVTITAVNLTNIDFTPEFEKSVEDKVIAEQQKEAAITKAEQELEVAKLEAQAEIEAARGNAESQKIIASAAGEAMAVKIVEIAKSIGFTVNETYIESVTKVVTNYETNEELLNTTTENEVSVKPESTVVVTKDEDLKQMTTITTSLTSTKYQIVYDETHTKEDLKIVMDFVKYLEYLEQWDGVLPNVVTGNEAVDIIVPTLG